ncbi:hypothetical protein AVEN_10097-1 [Araneus ventricosus]|uniref:Uncharacterized protein n=1 Tax=Araneus ventricosus TaxID=182803 RepID=A0A4Y2R6F7_ARAVE|nr:hypothetical protein AVEN_10097-1 [Araneus ventricosus]
MACVSEAQASVMRRRRSCNVGGWVAYTCPFMCPHKKMSNGVKSGEHEGHSTKPPYPMTRFWNVSIRYCLTFEILCEGRRHVGTIHFGVDATVDSQQRRLLHPAEAPSIVVPLTSPRKILVQ